MPGTYGVIKGAGVFLVGAMERGHRDMEDFGYLFEQIILFATELNRAPAGSGLPLPVGRWPTGSALSQRKPYRPSHRWAILPAAAPCSIRLFGPPWAQQKESHGKICSLMAPGMLH